MAVSQVHVSSSGTVLNSTEIVAIQCTTYKKNLRTDAILIGQKERRKMEENPLSHSWEVFTLPNT